MGWFTSCLLGLTVEASEKKKIRVEKGTIAYYLNVAECMCVISQCVFFGRNVCGTLKAGEFRIVMG
jgi:hypothetical protein